MTPQALKRGIADLIDDFCALNKAVGELREHNAYLESRISETDDCTALLARHTELVEAVIRLQKLDRDRPLHPVVDGLLIEARTEVDRLIGGE